VRDHLTWQESRPRARTQAKIAACMQAKATTPSPLTTALTDAQSAPAPTSQPPPPADQARMTDADSFTPLPPPPSSCLWPQEASSATHLALAPLTLAAADLQADNAFLHPSSARMVLSSLVDSLQRMMHSSACVRHSRRWADSPRHAETAALER